MKRNKAAILKSGIDPNLARLRKLHALKAVREKQLIAALEAIEDYWNEVDAAIDNCELLHVELGA